MTCIKFWNHQRFNRQQSRFLNEWKIKILYPTKESIILGNIKRRKVEKLGKSQKLTYEVVS